MTSVNDIRTAGGAGEPDDTLARRLDVVIAAEKWERAFQQGGDRQAAEWDLAQAVRRYRAAVDRRNRARA